MNKNNIFIQAKKVGTGDFGDIFEGVTGQDAINFLLHTKSGEVLNALSHPDIGENIDLVWGKMGENGYGLAHIVEKHGSVLHDIVRIMRDGNVMKQSKDRMLVIKRISHSTLIGVIRLDWNGKEKKWLVSAFEKL